jgi:hypothetical protein
MPTAVKNRWRGIDLILQGVMALCLLAYAGYRAAELDLVYDEACSFFWYAKGSLGAILLGVPPDANNHFLNSLFMKLSMGWLGPEELAMRWHSVAALGVYLAIVIAWLRSIQGVLLRLAGFLLLACNPYLLDFFSLARGYGLALTFTFGGAVCICRWKPDGNPRWLMGAVAFSAAAVLSNLCTLLFYASFLAIVCLKGIAESRRDAVSRRTMLALFWRTTRWAWWGSLALGAFLAVPLGRLMKQKAFGVGGHNGLWKDTVQTLVYDSLYRVDYGMLLRIVANGVKGAIAVSLVAGAVMLLLRGMRCKWDVLKESWVVAFVLVGTAGLASTMLHLFLGINYLADRLATFFIPLYVLYIIASAHELSQATKRSRRIVEVLAGVAILACGLHFLRSANAKWTLEWRYNYQTREVIDVILRDARQRNLPVVRLGVSFLFDPSMHYYREVDHLEWLVAVEKSWGGQSYDYYYLKDGLDDPPDGGRDLVTLRTYPDIGARLLRRERARR